MPVRIPAKKRVSEERSPEVEVTVHPTVECPVCGCEDILHIKYTEWYVCVNCHSRWR